MISTPLAWASARLVQGSGVKGEHGLALFLAGLTIACMISLTKIAFTGLMLVDPGAAASLARLNLPSATTLTAFAALSLANVQIPLEKKKKQLTVRGSVGAQHGSK